MALKTFREVAAELGIDRRAMPYLVGVLGITPKSIKHNARAKGLDDADVRRLKRAMDKQARLSVA